MYQHAPDPAPRPDSVTRSTAQPARRTLRAAFVALLVVQSVAGLAAVIHAYNLGDDDDLLMVGLFFLLAAEAALLAAVLYRPLRGVWIIAAGILRLLSDELDERR